MVKKTVPLHELHTLLFAILFVIENQFVYFDLQGGGQHDSKIEGETDNNRLMAGKSLFGLKSLKKKQLLGKESLIFPSHP